MKILLHLQVQLWTCTCGSCLR